MKNAKIGAALLGGYVLGRTKKGKAAIGLGAMLAGSRINPAQVGKTLQESPFVHTLTRQIRTELTGAGKAAATSVLTAKADSVANALHERTTGLREKTHTAEEQDTGEPEESAEAAETEETGETPETGEAGETKEREDEPEGTAGTRPPRQGAKKKPSPQGRSRGATPRARRPDHG
ncbi:MAG TPA: ABC transporter substrate-binding protein [Streptomyces sp.]|nr:ABC transporter substrate-binding protein [Streptomyces sp.]